MSNDQLVNLLHWQPVMFVYCLITDLIIHWASINICYLSDNQLICLLYWQPLMFVNCLKTYLFVLSEQSPTYLFIIWSTTKYPKCLTTNLFAYYIGKHFVCWIKSFLKFCWIYLRGPWFNPQSIQRVLGVPVLLLPLPPWAHQLK